MAKNKHSSIYEIYESRKSSDRDDRVIEKISLYFKNNIADITDGIIYRVPKISAEQRNLIAKEYNISDSDWGLIRQSPEFKLMKKLASPLNIGLVISYLDTKNKIFLTYLFILMYSSVYMKYMTKGSHNSLVMKYTIDTADNRTDFKRYECSLIAVVNKKVEAFVDNYKSGINNKNKPTDRFIRELVQASKTRINEMFKKLYGKYKNNMANPDVKVMMEYSKTPDGKHVLSMANIFEKLKEVSSESLFSPSDSILGSVGLGSKNVANFKYRALIIKHFNKTFGILSSANSMIIDKWIIANNSRLTMDNFKTTFISSMLNGRNISHIYDRIDDAVLYMISQETDNSVSYNKIQLRTYIYRYLVLNIYTASTKVFK